MNLNLDYETSWFEPLKDESSIQTPRYKQVSSPRIVSQNGSTPRGDPETPPHFFPNESQTFVTSTNTSSSNLSRNRPNSTSTPRQVKSVSISSPPESAPSTVRSRSSNVTSSKPILRQNSSVRSHKLLGTNHWQKSTFNAIRSECLHSGHLYEDVVFPADANSLSKHSKIRIKNVIWKRPHEIVRQPKFCVNDVSIWDIEPGKLGDTCLLSALTCLTTTPKLLQHCVPPEQEFDETYAGIFHFRFWRYGEWIDVVIDDFLPTVDGHLLYMRSTNPEEFWPSLLDKAYAKLYGSYENIHSGRINWALQDLTGGIVSAHKTTDSSKHLLTVVDLAMSRASLIGAYLSTANTGNQPGVLSNGLKAGHTYRITGYAEIPVTTGKIVLLRLHNAWHNANWNGAWSVRSPHWKVLNESTRSKMNINQLLEGEFWISFVDFKTIFTEIEICHLGPESWKLEPFLQRRGVWVASVAHRQWIHGFNAGGCVNPSVMCNNSQFYIEIEKSMAIIVSLMQKYRHPDDQRKFFSCSCLIYKVSKGTKSRFGPEFFLENKMYASTKFKQSRENVHTFVLPAGSYMILPVTEVEGQESRFLVRFYSAGNSFIWELDDKDTLTYIPITNASENKTTLIRRQFRNMAVHQKYEEIDATGLQKILATHVRDKIPLLCCFAESQLISFKPLLLSLETCKAAVTLFDNNVDGRLSYNEFNSLLSKLMVWQNTFRKFSKKNPDFTSYLLRDALKTLGFNVSNKTLETLIVRFSSKGRISLEQIICILIKLSTVHYRYKDRSSVSGEKKTSAISEILHTVIYS